MNTAVDLDKKSKHQANMKAIDEALAKWQNLDKLALADKHVPEKTSPEEFDKIAENLKGFILSVEHMNQNEMDRIDKQRSDSMQGDLLAEIANNQAEKAWYEDLDSAFKASREPIFKHVPGLDSGAYLSWLEMGPRAAMGTATGGSTEDLMTVTKALSGVKENLPPNEPGIIDNSNTIVLAASDEDISRYFEAATIIGYEEIVRRYVTLTNKVADEIEKENLIVNQNDPTANAGRLLFSHEDAAGNQEQSDIHLIAAAVDAAEGKLENSSII